MTVSAPAKQHYNSVAGYSGGSLVLLGEQDRTQWDRSVIEEGQAIVRACLRRNQPYAYQLQAAINAVHADALTIEDTDWSQIVAL